MVEEIRGALTQAKVPRGCSEVDFGRLNGLLSAADCSYDSEG